MKEYIVREIGFPGVLKQEIVGELIRCKDCMHWDGLVLCKKNGRTLYGVNDFCSKAERKNHE